VERTRLRVTVHAAAAFAPATFAPATFASATFPHGPHRSGVSLNLFSLANFAHLPQSHLLTNMTDESTGVATRTMKAILLAASAIVAFGIQAHANAVVIVEIKTKQGEAAYSINSQPFTLSELTKWMKSAMGAFGDKEPILIRPRSPTTLMTVFTLLESLRSCGATNFEIIAELSNSASGYTKRFLTSNAEQIKEEKRPLSEPPK